MNKFLLASDISVVSGAKNILLIDFRNHSYFSLEKDVGNFLQQRLIELQDLSDDDQELIDYLIKNDYGILCTESEVERFEELTDQWDFPATISNAIIEIEANSTHLKMSVESLANLNCEHLELRVARDVEEDKLYDFFEQINESGVFTIELVIPYSGWVNSNFAGKINDAFNLYLTTITIHSVPLDFKKSDEYSTTLFRYKTKPLTCLDCGNIDPKNFVPTIPFVMEGKRLNNCLNRKVGISANGQIKNCPSMQTSYGNVNVDSIEEVIRKEGFQEMWYINKDQVEVCKDCEFRTICMDCRAFLKDSKNRLSKPLKCGYDPYKGVWGEWSIGEAEKISANFYKAQFSK